MTGSQPGPVLPDLAAGTGDDSDKLDLVATVVNGTDATDLQQWLAQGPVRLRIGSEDATDQIAAFSAHGPAQHSYALKPDLVAPGVEIGSTWPGRQYRDDSGTSMAAPRIANLGLADLTGAQLAATRTVTLTNVSSRAQLVNLTGQPTSGSDQHVEVVPSSADLAPGRSVTIRLTLHADRPSTSTDLIGWLRASVAGSPTLTVLYLLAVRPLDLHADPDPTAGTAWASCVSGAGVCRRHELRGGGPGRVAADESQHLGLCVGVVWDWYPGAVLSGGSDDVLERFHAGE